jgi:hypothetical protein
MVCHLELVRFRPSLLVLLLLLREHFAMNPELHVQLADRYEQLVHVDRHRAGGGWWLRLHQ